MKNHSTSTATPSASPELSKVPAQREVSIKRAIGDVCTLTKNGVRGVLKIGAAAPGKICLATLFSMGIMNASEPTLSSSVAAIMAGGLSIRALGDWLDYRRKERRLKAEGVNTNDRFFPYSDGTLANKISEVYYAKREGTEFSPKVKEVKK